MTGKWRCWTKFEKMGLAIGGSIPGSPPFPFLVKISHPLPLQPFLKNLIPCLYERVGGMVWGEGVGLCIIILETGKTLKKVLQWNHMSLCLSCKANSSNLSKIFFAYPSHTNFFHLINIFFIFLIKLI